MASLLFFIIFALTSKRGEIYQISEVRANVLPPIYSLVDLMNDPVPGHFYAAQLTKAPIPNYKKDFFLVEKILGEKSVRGKKYFLVKFLFYPSKFNEYIPAENFKTSKE
jgi:hypothetical protein